MITDSPERKAFKEDFVDLPSRQGNLHVLLDLSLNLSHILGAMPA